MTVQSNYNENNHIIKGLGSLHKIVGSTIGILAASVNNRCGIDGFCNVTQINKILNLTYIENIYLCRIKKEKYLYDSIKTSRFSIAQ